MPSPLAFCRRGTLLSGCRRRYLPPFHKRLAAATQSGNRRVLRHRPRCSRSSSPPAAWDWPGATLVSLACATCKWKLSRPSALPVIFKAAVEMTAAQSENRVGSPYSPEHTRSFEAGADYSLAARFDHTRANKQMLAPKLGISHALRIPRKVVRFRAYLLGNVGIVSIHGT